jgi:hypothetical protein
MRTRSEIQRERSARSFKERFWSRVRKTDGCWVWTGQKWMGSHRYGVVRYEGKRKKAHRAAWFLATGEWPTLLVRHRCDNPECVRIDHLELGTHAENSADMVARGRSLAGDRSPMRRAEVVAKIRGERHPRAKLTEADVRRLRAEPKTMGYREMAAREGIGLRTLCQMLNGVTWRHVLPLQPTEVES